MTSLFRPHWVRYTLRPSTSQLPTRRQSFSSTSSVLREDGGAGVATAHNGGEQKEAVVDTDTYEQWIQSEGSKWRYPDPLGPKWLGGSVPFPRNPTFKPPIPLSDNLRRAIYDSYVANPVANDAHTLSTRYGVSVRRIEAIMRLKQLEAQWEKGVPLQIGFLKGMERILGVNVAHREKTISDEISFSGRNDVNEADELSRRANEPSEQKRGLSRTFFEPVDEGQEAVVPRLLDEHREKAAATKTKRTDYPSIVVQPNPSKPAFRFVDVGLRWFDSKDWERRQKESVRRKAIKAGKRAAKLVETISASAA